MSLLLACAVRMLFPPVTGQLQRVSAPAYWLKGTGEPIENPHIVIYVAILATVIIGILVAYQLFKRIS
jgi:hypothetical protein